MSQRMLEHDPDLNSRNDARNPYVLPPELAYRQDDPDRSYSLQVFVWPPGSTTRVHDHSSWGAFCCVVGSVLEERYERADDGSLPDYARLRKLWRFEWRREYGISTVLPYERGIHRVG